MRNGDVIFEIAKLHLTIHAAFIFCRKCAGKFQRRIRNLMEEIEFNFNIHRHLILVLLADEGGNSDAILPTVAGFQPAYTAVN